MSELNEFLKSIGDEIEIKKKKHEKEEAKKRANAIKLLELANAEWSKIVPLMKEKTTGATVGKQGIFPNMDSGFILGGVVLSLRRTGLALPLPHFFAIYSETKGGVHPVAEVELEPRLEGETLRWIAVGSGTKGPLTTEGLATALIKKLALVYQETEQPG